MGSDQAAIELAIVVGHQQTFHPGLDAKAFVENHVEEWIHEQWLELDAMFQKNAEERVFSDDTSPPSDAQYRETFVTEKT